MTRATGTLTGLTITNKGTNHACGAGTNKNKAFCYMTCARSLSSVLVVTV